MIPTLKEELLTLEEDNQEETLEEKKLQTMRKLMITIMAQALMPTQMQPIEEVTSDNQNQQMQQDRLLERISSTLRLAQFKAWDCRMMMFSLFILKLNSKI